jgi:RimJ/RimL family protein N-acetyltransferase
MTLPINLILGPTLETERLILRPPVAEDFEGFCAFFADELTMRHLGGPLTPAPVWRTFRSVVGSWVLDGFAMFSVIEKSSGQWIGRIGPHYPLGWPDREVGWGLLSAHWGRGYALEAASASMDYAFDTLGWQQVVHVIAPDNTPSQAVAKALGSRNLGSCQLPDPYGDRAFNAWGQSREEWAKNKAEIKTRRQKRP